MSPHGAHQSTHYTELLKINALDWVKFNVLPTRSTLKCISLLTACSSPTWSMMSQIFVTLPLSSSTTAGFIQIATRATGTIYFWQVPKVTLSTHGRLSRPVWQLQGQSMWAFISTQTNRISRLRGSVKKFWAWLPSARLLGEKMLLALATVFY